MNPLKVHRAGSRSTADKPPAAIILGFFIVILAGSILGAVVGYKTSGIIAACAGAILGGIAGLFAALNVFCGIEALLVGILRVFTRRRE